MQTIPDFTDGKGLVSFSLEVWRGNKGRLASLAARARVVHTSLAMET